MASRKSGKKSAARKYSSIMVDGIERAPSRAMLRAVGFKDDDFKKSQVGVASTWSMVTPCNMHVGGLADEAAKAADEAGAKGVVFNTISVSDGISMGTPGLRYSLVSREIIADCNCIDQQQNCSDGGVSVGDCQCWPWQGAAIFEFEAISLNRHTGIGLSVPHKVSSDLIIDTCMEAINVTAAVQRAVQMQFEQLNDGTRCQNT